MTSEQRVLAVLRGILLKLEVLGMEQVPTEHKVGYWRCFDELNISYQELREKEARQ